MKDEEFNVRRLAVLTCLVATLGSVVACNSTTTGQPGGATTTNDGGPPSNSASSSGTSTSVGGGHALPVDHPCSLLLSNDLAALGVSSAPTEQLVGSAHTCNFDSASFSMGVAIRTNVGLGGFQNPGGTPRNITIGTHQAKQEVDNTGACTVAIGVSDSSRVDVVASPILNGDPCPTALKVANMIAPKLP